MDINIQSLSSTVRAVDGSSLATPEVMEQILQMVMQANEARERDQKRERADRRVTPGVAYDLEQAEA
jgi:hypothetical protein